MGIPSQFTELSAAASNDVFTVATDGSGWELRAGVWTQWAPGGTVQ
jgi:hypothetical protein